MSRRSSLTGNDLTNAAAASRADDYVVGDHHVVEMNEQAFPSFHVPDSTRNDVDFMRRSVSIPPSPRSGAGTPIQGPLTPPVQLAPAPLGISALTLPPPIPLETLLATHLNQYYATLGDTCCCACAGPTKCLSHLFTQGVKPFAAGITAVNKATTTGLMSAGAFTIGFQAAGTALSFYNFLLLCFNLVQDNGACCVSGRSYQRKGIIELLRQAKASIVGLPNHDDQRVRLCIDQIIAQLAEPIKFQYTFENFSNFLSLVASLGLGGVGSYRLWTNRSNPTLEFWSTYLICTLIVLSGILFVSNWWSQSATRNEIREKFGTQSPPCFAPYLSLIADASSLSQWCCSDDDSTMRNGVHIFIIELLIARLNIPTRTSIYPASLAGEMWQCFGFEDILNSLAVRNEQPSKRLTVLLAKCYDHFMGICKM